MGYVFSEEGSVGLKSNFLSLIKSLIEINNKKDFYQIHKND